MTQFTESPLTPAEVEVKALITRVANRGATIELAFDQSQEHESGQRRQLRKRYVPLAAVVTVAAVVAVIVLLVARPSAPPSPIASPTGGGSASLQMQLVDSTSSPFASVGGGPQTGDLLCVTSSTCYASDDTAPGGMGWEATADGGMTWRTLAALPQGRLLSDPVACPTPTTCVGVAAPTVAGGLAPSEGPQLALTSDGGRSWRLDSLPVPPGESHATIERLSCPTASDCVAFLTNSPTTSSNFFLTTTDGGSTWTSSNEPAGLTGLWALHCDEDGDCIGLDPTGSVQDPNAEGIVAIRSDDWGATWTTSTRPMPFGPGVLVFDCGDAVHCILAFGNGSGTTFDLARTADGGQTWVTSAAPSGWPSLAISLSCADGEDCYLSASDYAKTGYESPAVEVTHDGGASWTSLQLPEVKAQPLALVYPLSCPVAAGCIGVGATVQEFDTPPKLSAPPNLTAPPSPNNNRVIISNLSSSTDG